MLGLSIGRICSSKHFFVWVVLVLSPCKGCCKSLVIYLSISLINNYINLAYKYLVAKLCIQHMPPCFWFDYIDQKHYERCPKNTSNKCTYGRYLKRIGCKVFKPPYARIITFEVFSVKIFLHFFYGQ
jgi:hypothetical protein